MFLLCRPAPRGFDPFADCFVDRLLARIIECERSDLSFVPRFEPLYQLLGVMGAFDPPFAIAVVVDDADDLAVALDGDNFVLAETVIAYEGGTIYCLDQHWFLLGLLFTFERRWGRRL